VEPHPRRIVAEVGGAVVIDTERALLIHRPGQTLTYLFPIEEVAHLAHELEPAADGYASVPWASVDRWIEEGRVLVDYPPNPYHRVDCRPTQRRLRVTVGGRRIVDTTDTLILFETALAPRLYVRPALVTGAALGRSAHTSYCNYKGHATYWDVTIDGATVEQVAWSYEDPLPESRAIAGLFSFDLDRATVEAELPRA
jgi:uncharacterized protein (DUF427 family)